MQRCYIPSHPTRHTSVLVTVSCVIFLRVYIWNDKEFLNSLSSPLFIYCTFCSLLRTCPLYLCMLLQIDFVFFCNHNSCSSHFSSFSFRYLPICFFFGFTLTLWTTFICCRWRGEVDEGAQGESGFSALHRSQPLPDRVPCSAQAPWEDGHFDPRNRRHQGTIALVNKGTHTLM